MQSAITAIGTALPLYKRAQEDIAEFIAEVFHLTLAQKKVLKRIYQSSHIDYRHSVLTDYAKSPGSFEFFPNEPSASFPSTAERMAVYKAHALPLALAAIDDCLSESSLSRDAQLSRITHVITVSCTGMYAPGIDIEIVQSLQLSSSTQRTSINFMGCYGAFNGMKVADAICRANPDACVLLVCVELCSIHIQNDFTLENMVSNALFADGAAAVLIQNESKSVAKKMSIHSFYCDLIPQSSQEMAWHIGDSGFDMVLSAYIPEAIQSGIRAFTDKLLQQTKQSFSDIDYFAIHPGGVKILQACEAAFPMTAFENRFSYQVLRENGNMSSATVLFVLKKIWQELTEQEHGKTIFSCAFGPGLTLESMMLNVRYGSL